MRNGLSSCAGVYGSRLLEKQREYDVCKQDMILFKFGFHTLFPGDYSADRREFHFYHMKLGSYPILPSFLPLKDTAPNL